MANATTLFTPETLLKHVSQWELAVFASDVTLFAKPGELSDSFLQLLERGESERDAWLFMVGSVMPPVVAAHFALRKKVRSAWRKPKHVARCLAQWVENHRALITRSFTASRLLCQRLQGFALMLSPDEVAGMHASEAPCTTLASVLVAVNYNWAIAASVTVLLHLLRGEAQGKQPHFVGATTAIPSSWNATPSLGELVTDGRMPAGTSNRYAVLLSNASGEAAHIVVVSSMVGQEREWQMSVDVSAAPVQWVATCDDALVVGGASDHVAVVNEDGVNWHQVAATPPPRSLLVRLHPHLLWSQRGEVQGMDLRTLRRVVDTTPLQPAMLRASVDAVAACATSNLVFSNGRVLFQLLPHAGQHVVAVHRGGEDLVDVFTDVGDWWRVNVKTLVASVVGLTAPRGFKVVDACVYE
jgi:hypothetical protein